MQIAIISDTHIGVRNDHSLFLNAHSKFFEEVFFPYIDLNNIDTVIHLGDVVDRRKYINYNTANRLRKDLFEPLAKRNMNTYFIIGNHDTHHKSSNKINALRELCKKNYSTFKIYDEYPEEVTFDNMSILFIPWICDENREESIKRIQNSTAKIAMGHLEISGFEMHKGSIVSHGQDRDFFSKFNEVYSGHFHHKSTDGHIFYLGSIGEFTWSDYNDDKGFHIFDTETKEMKFIRNPRKIHHKINYNDSDTEFVQSSIDFSSYKDCIVKVIVKEKNNLYWFDTFIENLEKANPYDIQIVEDTLNLNLEDEESISEVESTLDICYSYIDKIDSKSNYKDKVKNMLNNLYNEAIVR